MVQNPKGGGLSSSLGGSQMMGGVQKTTDFLDKSTWTLAIIDQTETSESKPEATTPTKPASENQAPVAPATEKK